MAFDTSLDLVQSHSILDIKIEHAEVELLAFGDGVFLFHTLCLNTP